VRGYPLGNEKVLNICEHRNKIEKGNIHYNSSEYLGMIDLIGKKK
jgi:hypothetical protein